MKLIAHRFCGALAPFVAVMLLISCGGVGEDGTGAAVQDYNPVSVVAGTGPNAGYLYAVDSRQHVVLEISEKGVRALAGKAQESGNQDGFGTEARFNWPFAIALDGAGHAYVTDTANHSIRKIKLSNGQVTTEAGAARHGAYGHFDATGSKARFHTPRGIAVDKEGNILVSDTDNHAIRKITPGGHVTTVAGSPAVGGSTDGLAWNAQFKYPESIAFDSKGNLYIADSVSHTVRKLTPAGMVSTLAGNGSAGYMDGSGGSNGEARFNAPHGIAIDRQDNVYVTDTDNYVIRKITQNQGAVEVKTVAGNAGVSGNSDGPGTNATFQKMQGIAVDKCNNLYIADTENRAIRKVSPDGNVSKLGEVEIFSTCSGETSPR